MSKVIRIDGIIGNGAGEINSQWFRSQLPENGTEPIEVKIHSEGGSVFEGFAIYDAAVAYQGPKKVSIESSAFSIASFIPMAFDEVEITPNGYLFLHDPRIGVDGSEGTDEVLDKNSAMLKQLKTNMVEAYAKRTGKSPDEITAMLKTETYLNAKQAVANGFVDRIAEKPVTGRVFARLDRMPHGVVSALFGADSGGNQEPLQEKTMSDSTPVAATIQEIKAAYPKAKAEFVVTCLERALPMASVAQAAVEEMMAENSALAAKCKAMEEELTALKGSAKAEETVPAEEEEAPAEAVAVAKKSGAKPVARATVSKPSPRAQWSELLDTKIATGMSRGDAIMAIERQSPGLRAAMLAEANAR